MKQGTQNGMKGVAVSVDLMVAFAIINNAGIMIDTGVNAKN